MSISGAAESQNTPIQQRHQIQKNQGKVQTGAGAEKKDPLGSPQNIPIPNPFVQPEKLKRKSLLAKKRVNAETGELEEVDGDDAFFVIDDMDLGKPQVAKFRNGLPQLPWGSPHDNREYRNKDLPDVLEAKTGIKLKKLKKTLASAIEQCKGPEAEMEIEDYKKAIVTGYDSALEWNEVDTM